MKNITLLCQSMITAEVNDQIGFEALQGQWFFVYSYTSGHCAISLSSYHGYDEDIFVLVPGAQYLVLD